MTRANGTDPLVSVFVFCRNRAAMMRRSAASVLAQTWTHLEYVVQDGASTDGTVEVVRGFADPRVEIVSAPDSGPAEAFWAALRRCRGDYVCACLSDEELLPHAVAEAVALLEADPDAVAVIRDVHGIDAEGQVIGTVRGEPFQLEAYLANRTCPNFASAMFRRSALDLVGLHTRPWEPECGEFELWCRLALLGPIRYVPGVVAHYGIHDGQLSREPANAVRLAHGRLRVIDALAAETSVFVGREAIWRACRLETLRSFARHLNQIGAPREAMTLLLDSAVAGDPLPVPRAATPASDYVAVAHGLRTAGCTAVALEVLDVGGQCAAVDAQFLYELGCVHAIDGQADTALSLFTHALDLDPTHEEARWERGLLLEQRGEIDGAIADWAHAGLDRDARRHSTYLVACLKSPRSTNRSLFEAHASWARTHALPPLGEEAGRLPDWRPGEIAVVGYACSFWDADTITFQLLPMLRRRDRSRFRVIAYAHTPPGPLVRAAVDEVRVVGGLSQDAYVRRVRADGVHILVEINGHSPGHWFAAMAARCAPIQVSYLNYTSTSGVAQVDYVLGDRVSVPAGTDAWYTERVKRLPGCFFCFTYDGEQLPPVGDPPAARNGHVTFGCFGSAGKMNPELLDLWGALLRRVPGSTLYVRNGGLTSRDNRLAFVRAMSDRGVEPSRLRVRAGTSRTGVLESYGDVDISLDTFPYCGGNTIAESLWQGVPVVTLQGDRFSSAYGASLLAGAGTPELIARSPEAYVQVAADLAGDLPRLRYYRAHLRQMVKQHGFSDADRFTARLEAAYSEMLTDLARHRGVLAVAATGDMWRAPMPRGAHGAQIAGIPRA